MHNILSTIKDGNMDTPFPVFCRYIYSIPLLKWQGMVRDKNMDIGNKS